MPSFGPTELIIILVIVFVLLGVGRISKIAGEMGSSNRDFRDGLQSEEKEKDSKNQESAVKSSDSEK